MFFFKYSLMEQSLPTVNTLTLLFAFTIHHSWDGSELPTQMERVVN